MYICRNGTEHAHSNIAEGRACWTGPPVSPAATSTPATRPYETHTTTWRDSPISPRQLDYIVRILGGDLVAAEVMTQGVASKYIDRLKGVKPVSSPTPPLVAEPAWSPPPPVKKVTDPRLEMVRGLIGGVPDGYFATQSEAGAKINFVRLSHPKRNKFAGGLKIQTQHADSLETEAVLWPSGSWSVYRSSIIDILLLLVTDHRTAALRYGRESKRCTRCNTSLTDGYSLHYGIGPICDKIWPWVIDMVDDRNDGKTYEQLVREGSPLVSRRS